MTIRNGVAPALAGFLLVVLSAWTVFAMDSEITRRTLVGLPGFFVVFEEIQPDLRQQAVAEGISRDRLLKDVSLRLQKAGIKLLSQEQWMNTQGRPVLYVNLNTHREGEVFAYNIRLEVRQLAHTDMSPPVKALVGTWGINMTGLAKTGRLGIMRENVLNLTDKFIEAYRAVNSRDSKK